MVDRVGKICQDGTNNMMLIAFRRLGKFVAVAALLSAGAFATIAYASHSWGGYHWARSANPFNLEVGDNVSAVWDTYLATTSNNWNLSSALDTTIVLGSTNPKNCRPTLGRVEVCNSKYGRSGWLGVAQIWVSGDHIVQGVTKLNDTYFNTKKYNTPGWRNLVMCQEAGHTFGLDHQDEIFSNLNLGTCMDYTDDPDGALKGQISNENPNQHDYDQLDLIYAHFDSTTSALATTSSSPSDWGKVIRRSADGRSSLHEKDLGRGNKLFTFVIWAE